MTNAKRCLILPLAFVLLLVGCASPRADLRDAIKEIHPSLEPIGIPTTESLAAAVVGKDTITPLFRLTRFPRCADLDKHLKSIDCGDIVYSRRTGERIQLGAWGEAIVPAGVLNVLGRVTNTTRILVRLENVKMHTPDDQARLWSCVRQLRESDSSEKAILELLKNRSAWVSCSSLSAGAVQLEVDKDIEGGLQAEIVAQAVKAGLGADFASTRTLKLSNPTGTRLHFAYEPLFDFDLVKQGAFVMCDIQVTADRFPTGSAKSADHRLLLRPKVNGTAFPAPMEVTIGLAASDVQGSAPNLVFRSEHSWRLGPYPENTVLVFYIEGQWINETEEAADDKEHRTHVLTCDRSVSVNLASCKKGVPSQSAVQRIPFDGREPPITVTWTLTKE